MTTVTCQFGTFSRDTKRAYTHIVICNGLHASYINMMVNSPHVSEAAKAGYRAEAEAQTNGTAKYGVLSWCGSLDLAVKAARKASSPRRLDNVICHANVKIIEISTGNVVG